MSALVRHLVPLKKQLAVAEEIGVQDTLIFPGCEAR